MGIINIFRGLSTLGKATKFLKQQDEIKEQALNLIEQIKAAVETFEKFVANAKDVITRLKEVVTK